MARTLLITLGAVASLFGSVSYWYYLSHDNEKHNLMYETGKFLDDLWFKGFN